MKQTIGHGIELRNGDVNLHAVAAGGGYIWCGCATNPSRLVKISTDLTEYKSIVIEGTYGLHDLCWDGDFTWVAHASGHLTRIDPDNDRQTNWPLHISDGRKAFAYAAMGDDRYIWLGMYTDPGRILRFDKQTGALHEHVITDAPMWSVRALTASANWIWTSIYDNPGFIAGINQITGEQHRINLPESDILPSVLTAANNFLWAGLDTMPARVVKIDPANNTCQTIPFMPWSSSVRALIATQNTLWAALYSEPACLVRLDMETDAWEWLALPNGFDNSRSMASDETNLYIGLQNRRHQPSALYVMPLTAHGRKDEPAPQVNLTAQDWYRVRRGEDQLRWGMQAGLADLPAVTLSKRAGEEFALLEESARNLVLAWLRNHPGHDPARDTAMVHGSGDWRMKRIAELRVIYRTGGRAGQNIEIATIRQQEGVAFDPENMSLPPTIPGLIWQNTCRQFKLSTHEY